MTNLETVFSQEYLGAVRCFLAHLLAHPPADAPPKPAGLFDWITGG